MMRLRFWSPRLDLLNIALLTIMSLALSGFLLGGAYLDTTYADWMYHAFRAQSLIQHGLISWDNNWDNGISYWRSYQMVPAAITALTSIVLHVSVPKAMIILSVILYTLLHLSVYGSLRIIGRKPYESFAAALLSFMFSGYWLIMKDYSISFAAVAVAPMLLLWYFSHGRPSLKLWFTFAVGLSIYIHPLLATTFGGLWLFDKFVRRADFSIRRTLLEFAVMVAPAFFYAYSMVGMDATFVAPYQLTKEFIYLIAGSYQAGGIFYLIVPVLFFIAAFVGPWLSSSSRVLFWYTTIIVGLTWLNIRTPVLDILNRFQLSRTLFFVVMAYIFVSGEAIGSATARTNKLVRGSVLAVLIGLALSQSLADTARFGPIPVATLPDPVTAFKATSAGHDIIGNIYLDNPTTSTYNYPTLRFTNGYNAQLLPKLANDRLSRIFIETAPTSTVSSADADQVADYANVLAIQYIFLPQSSPYIKALAANGFTVAATVAGQDFRMTVLKSPGTLRYAVEVPSASANVLTMPGLTARPGTLEYSRQLDAVITRAAAIKTSATEGATVGVGFPAPDRLDIVLPARIDGASNNRTIYLDQSYSRHWHTSVGTIKKTTEGMMVLEVPADITIIHLNHTWDHAVIIEAATAGTALAAVIIATVFYSRRKSTPEVTS